MTGAIAFRSVRSNKRRAALLDLESISRKMIVNALDKAADALKRSLEEFTRSWKTDVNWTVEINISSNRIEVIVGTDSKIAEYVDKGTDPHTIVAKNAPSLAFRPNYKAKTAARPARVNAAGGVSTGEYVYTKFVFHPGSEPRNFTKAIAEDFQPKFRQFMENVFREISRSVEEY